MIIKYMFDRVVALMILFLWPSIAGCNYGNPPPPGGPCILLFT